MQVLLNGGKQHVFQSAMRATARLNLLSPAVFPLPFGSKVLPFPVTPEKGAQKEQEAELAEEAPVKGNAVTPAAASLKDSSNQAKHAQHAQHTQPVLPTAAVPNAAVQMGLELPTSRHAKHAQRDQPAPDFHDLKSISHNGSCPSPSMPRCQDRSGTSGQDTVRTGSSKPQQITPGAGKAHKFALMAGPVVKFVGSSTGLVTAPWDESEVQCQSPGM